LSVQSKYIDRRANEDNNDRQKEREREIHECPKNSLRNECVKMLLAATAISVPILNPEAKEEVIAKSRQIYSRLLDVIFKIDCIEGEGSGTEYIGLQELGTDHKLGNKYSVISSAMWGEAANPNDKRDWQSVLEAVERDLIALNNHYKYKRLLDKVADERQGRPVDADDIFTKGWEIKGPWNAVMEAIRQDFESTELMKQKIDTQLVKIQELGKYQLILKREKDELSLVN